MKRTRILAAITAALLGTAAPAAHPQADEPRLETSARSYSDEDIRSFATAVVRVQRLNDAYLPRLAAARNETEEQEVMKAAVEAMAQAVEETGLSVDQYDAILTEARASPGLAERIRQHIMTVEE